MTSEIDQLLRHASPGADTTVRKHIERSERIAAAIHERWGICRIRQWQVKHVRWFLEVWCPSQGIGEAGRYDYWLTVRVVSAALNRLSDWEGYLEGPWRRGGTGGRKPRLTTHATPRRRSAP